LNAWPRGADIVQQTVASEHLWETLAETILIFTLIDPVLASTLASGGVDESARIAPAGRGRELARLRVLGFSRGEVPSILLWQLGLRKLAALAAGCLIGHGFCGFNAAAIESELYCLPRVLASSTDALAGERVIAPALVSGRIVWRRLGAAVRVAVPKTRE
jgi:putative ABC transport system permease protein